MAKIKRNFIINSSSNSYLGSLDSEKLKIGEGYQ